MLTGKLTTKDLKINGVLDGDLRVTKSINMEDDQYTINKGTQRGIAAKSYLYWIDSDNNNSDISLMELDQLGNLMLTGKLTTKDLKINGVLDGDLRVAKSINMGDNQYITNKGTQRGLAKGGYLYWIDSDNNDEDSKFSWRANSDHFGNSDISLMELDQSGNLTVVGNLTTKALIADSNLTVAGHVYMKDNQHIINEGSQRGQAKKSYFYWIDSDNNDTDSRFSWRANGVHFGNSDISLMDLNQRGDLVIAGNLVTKNIVANGDLRVGKNLSGPGNTLTVTGDLNTTGLLRPGISSSLPACSPAKDGSLYYDTDGGVNFVGGLYICDGDNGDWEAMHSCAN